MTIETETPEPTTPIGEVIPPPPRFDARAWLEPALHGEEATNGTTRWYGDRAALFDALARAQGAFPPIPRTREVTIRMKAEKGGGTYTYKYAPLDQVIEACKSALAENGLAYTDRIVEIPKGRMLVSYLTHRSGAYGEARLKLPEVDNPKDFGAAVTYARRYQRQCMLGVSPEEDQDAPDDDETERVGYRSDAPPRSDRHPNAPDDERPPKPPHSPTGSKPSGTFDDMAQAALVDFRARVKAAGASKELLTPLKIAMDEYKGHAVFDIAAKEFIAAWKVAR